MPEVHPWILSSIIILGVLWLLTAVLYIRRRQYLHKPAWLDAALLTWPLCLFDELVVQVWQPLLILYGTTDWVPVLLMALFYRALKPSLVANPSSSRYLLWYPVILCIIIQLPLAFSGIAEKHMLIESTPVGHPLDFWPVYISAMINGFTVLVLGLLMTELVQKYHKHLPNQVAVPSQYRLRWLAGALGATVGLAMIGILLVTAVTFGFLHILAWQTGLDLAIAAVMLTILFLLTIPQRTSPSILDYNRFDAGDASPDAMRHALAKTGRILAILPSSTRNQLTIGDVARQAKVDPTTLALASRLLEQQSFAEFVARANRRHEESGQDATGNV